MSGKLRVLLILMATLTVIYAVAAVTYASTDVEVGICPVCGESGAVHALYGADKLETTPSDEWYLPEELGICDVEKDYGGWIHIGVNKLHEPFSLQEEQPIFLMNGQFYKVIGGWCTPGLPESIPRQRDMLVLGAGGLGTGWVFTGILLFRRRSQK